MTRIKNSKGFTLIELIVVIVIIGILAAIAAVAYNAFIANAQATQVKTSALQIAQVIQGESAFARGAADVPANVASTSTWAAGTVQVGNADMSAAAVGDINSAINDNMSFTATAPNVINLTDGDATCVITLSPEIGGTSAVTGC